MGFQTFTCVICGKEGLTKRNSYAYGDGRACREHQEACNEAELRKNAQEAKATAKRMDARIHPNFIRKPISANYVMENLDPRPEANLLLNLQKFTHLECIGDVSIKSISVIFDSEQAKNNFHPCTDQLLEKLTDGCEEKTYVDVLNVICDSLATIEQFRYFDSNMLHELKIKVLTELVEIFKVQMNAKIEDDLEKEIEAVEKHCRTLQTLLGEYDNSQNKIRSASMIPDIQAQMQMDEISMLAKTIFGWIWNKSRFPKYAEKMSYYEAAKKILDMAVTEGIVTKPEK